MNGIINVLKPPGMTSFDVVGYLRRILKTKKIGHTGTLDPAACGVLLVCVGNATKAIEFLTDDNKRYTAELTLGIETDTQDSTGQILSCKNANISAESIKEAIEFFKGDILQIPPMYSAIKLNGKKLYELARQGISVEREARKVHIYFIEILSINKDKVLFDVKCSKGTYIRTLCADMGKKLGCGGHMSFLLRTAAGGFTLDTSLTIQQVEEYAKNGEIASKLIKVESVFSDLNHIRMSANQFKLFINGVFVKTSNTLLKEGDILKVYDHNNKFSAIGEVIRRDSLYIKSKKQFI